MTTYRDLTNRLLRRLNEVEIPETDFPSVTGVHAAAKDAILDTIREINSRRPDWPFNAVEHSQTLLVGVEEYAWPSDFTSVDWNSYQIQKDESLNINSKTLSFMNKEEWYKYARDQDYDSGTDGKNIPEYVFPTHGNGWGVTPSPNESYPIKFRYFKTPVDLVAYNDVCTIPPRFDYVIIAGAMVHMGLFKEDAETIQIAQLKFEKGIKDMVNMYNINPLYAYTGVVNQGGGSSYSHGVGGFYWR